MAGSGFASITIGLDSISTTAKQVWWSLLILLWNEDQIISVFFEDM